MTLPFYCSCSAELSWSHTHTSTRTCLVTHTHTAVYDRYKMQIIWWYRFIQMNTCLYTPTPCPSTQRSVVSKHTQMMRIPSVYEEVCNSKINKILRGKQGCLHLLDKTQDTHTHTNCIALPHSLVMKNAPAMVSTPVTPTPEIAGNLIASIYLFLLSGLSGLTDIYSS